MAWIETVGPDEATGLLARLYKAALDRAGKVFHVVRVQSLRPHSLHASTNLYSEIMRSDRSPLSRTQREMLAVVVSRANACRY